MIELSKVDAGYGRDIVVKNVSISIQKGEIISLIGPNGGGKSTLLKSINKQISLLGGNIFIDGKDSESFSAKELSKKMSIVTTKRIEPQLMTCMDVVLSGRLPYADGLGLVKDSDIKEARKSMDIMNIENLSNILFVNLSDGQKQRALIARAICQNPEFLVMDEPTSYMDIRHRLQLMDVVKKLSSAGITIIMSIHELELALEVSDKLILVFDDGHIDYMTPKTVVESKILKTLFNLDDTMYSKVIMTLGGESKYIDDKDKNLKEKESKIRYSSFFVNTKCEYFPCHKMPVEKFNCMFCYCPLYDVDDCGGDYYINAKGIKDCINCTYIHDRDNYPQIIKKIKKKMGY
ncbi:ATP-binding cassette domain-containing protein [Butyrivibrio sp. NC3005]|uniref:ATP-binding cassette domain-containing protein n=1 Tax=Butyrivibrio sp. NC3005 TaxID=1280685 RepID=UPI0004252B2B|nr:ATP-binding cassette domain-containing protein [Butyrivibrio sp. NC3005]